MSEVSNEKIYEITTATTRQIKKANNQTRTETVVDVPVGQKTETQSKSKNRTFDYELGPREGNTRIVGPDSISSASGTNTTTSHLNGIASLYHRLQENNTQITTNDGYFGTSNQRLRGDCYLLAEINGIRNTQHGQEILKQNVRTNADGSMTVTLPGAVKFRNKCIQDGNGDKCEVTGTYHITKDALKKAQRLAGDSYSQGDIEIIALEIAMENFRAEMLQTNKNLGNRRTRLGELEDTTNIEQVQDGTDYLSGGFAFEAAFLLTGQKSEVYRNSQKHTQLYKDG